MDKIHKDMMIDIEALGDCITQIGACVFNRFTGEIYAEFSINIDPNSGVQHGLGLEVGPVMFWLKTCSETGELPSWVNNPVDLQTGLLQFKAWHDIIKEQYGIRRIWSHTSYDPVLLKRAYAAIGMDTPWKYSKLGDIRTLVDLAGVTLEKTEHTVSKTHDGLEDCRYQVEYCVACFNKLKSKKGKE